MAAVQTGQSRYAPGGGHTGSCCVPRQAGKPHGRPRATKVVVAEVSAVVDRVARSTSPAVGGIEQSPVVAPAARSGLYALVTISSLRTGFRTVARFMPGWRTFSRGIERRDEEPCRRRIQVAAVVLTSWLFLAGVVGISGGPKAFRGIGVGPTASVLHGWALCRCRSCTCSLMDAEGHSRVVVQQLVTSIDSGTARDEPP